MKAGPRHLVAAIAALALSAALPASASAGLASPLRAVFLQEFSKPLYTMAEGDILSFENDDPFLLHGIAGPVTAPTTQPGGSRLVRNASFLPVGKYSFGCTVHPGMSGTLEVVPGTPLPADAARPSARVKVARISAKRVIGGGAIQIRVAPSEPAEAETKVFAGRKLIGTSSVALPTGARGSVSVTPSERGEKLLAGRLSRGALKLTARTTVTDLVGNAVKVTKSRRVAALKTRKG
jgi:hypothetical protein